MKLLRIIILILITANLSFAEMNIFSLDQASNQYKEIKLYNKLYVVIIGIDQYKNLPANTYLKYAVRDAKGVEEVFKNNFTYDKLFSLYDKEATKENILRVFFDDLGRDLGEDDAVFVFWAGHAHTEKSLYGDLGYLIPYDGSFISAELNKNISINLFKNDLSNALSVKNAFFMFEASLGGLQMLNKIFSKSGRDINRLEESSREKTWQIIVAGDKGQQVLDRGVRGFSIFAGRFIEILENTNDFLTASGVSNLLRDKVTSDARTRRQMQTPQFGEFFGNGDFSFLPDFKKLLNLAETNIVKIEEELRRLSVLKGENNIRKNKEKLNEITNQEIFLKETVYPQLISRIEISKKQIALRENISLDSGKVPLSMNLAEVDLEKDLTESLEKIKLQAEKIKQELSLPIFISLSFSETIGQVKKTNELIARVENLYQSELSKKIIPLKAYYQFKIKQKENIPLRDKGFETETYYSSRIKKIKEEIEELKTEFNQKEAPAILHFKSEMGNQLKSLFGQRDLLTKQEFSVGNEEIKFKLYKYNPEKKEFPLSVEVKGKLIIGLVNISNDKAKEYFQNPQLLTADALLAVSADATFEILKINLRREGEEIFPLKRILPQLFPEMEFGYTDLTATDIKTGIVWIRDANLSGKSMPFKDALEFVNQMNRDGYGGFYDWRLPEKEEFESLINYAKNKGYRERINELYNNKGFKNVQAGNYWTKTSFVTSNGYAWYVNVLKGKIEYNVKTHLYFFWPMRIEP